MRIFLFLSLPLLLFSAKPNLLLLKVYKNQDLTGWVMSEKLDGVRAYWDGKQLLSRGGKIIHAPKWFSKDFPPFEVDGELWTHRKDFENISSIVRDKTPTKAWHQISYNIFEVPHAQGNLFTRLAKVKPYESQRLKIIPQIPIVSQEAMLAHLHSIESKGAEGLVVRDPLAPYINKRTAKALKVKSFLDDECKVVGYTKGRGKFLGMMGALKCELSCGVSFKIGSGFTKKERQNPPAIGSLVTFKYKEFTKYKKPRFPIFLRVRKER